MFLVDSHCHLDSLNYEQKTAAAVIDYALTRDVKYCLSVATSLSGYQSMRNTLDSFDNLAFSCGVHPLNLADEPFDLALFKRLATDSRVVALGETGLDYYYQQDNIKQQQQLFAEHIELGRVLHKPVIVHTRSARQDTLCLLTEGQVDSGVLHCFTEDIPTAKKILDLGMYISFSGIITFKNAQPLRDVARYVPLDRLLVETDSPYLAPIPYRGKENQPAYVREVAEYLAVLKQTTVEHIAQVTSHNFSALFNINLPE